MFKSYLTIAIRSLLKRRGYSLINIIGLAIGMAAVIVIVSAFLTISALAARAALTNPVQTLRYE